MIKINLRNEIYSKQISTWSDPINEREKVKDKTIVEYATHWFWKDNPKRILKWEHYRRLTLNSTGRIKFWFGPSFAYINIKRITQILKPKGE